MALDFTKLQSKKLAPQEPSGGLPPKAPTEAEVQQLAAANARLQFLQQQTAFVMSNTRTLKCALIGCISNNELAPETKQWLFAELLEMAKMVEVEE